MFKPDRSRILKEGATGEGPVVYWMSREQRVHDSWPLLYASEFARQKDTDLLVGFCLTLSYPAANLRHYTFMLNGLEEVAGELAKLNIPFFLLEGEPPDVLPAFLQRQRAGMLVCDFDPLRVKLDWKSKVVRAFPNRVVEVDGHNIIPCWVASGKQEYAAYTFRPKVNRQLAGYLTDFPVLPPSRKAPKEWPMAFNRQELFTRIPDRSVRPVEWLQPGEQAARLRLTEFIRKVLPRYDSGRNDPNQECQSGLSPYLHFGQISAQRIALSVKESETGAENRDGFLEELIVRRELADNYCFYNTDYDTVSGFPSWARQSLAKHRKDRREYLYDLEDLETADTHDPLWNAAQKDMVVRGKLHGYLRMYWAKKILEWTDSPETALKYAQFLNDKYELDGRDPNGYTGVAWSIGGVHDRAWPERPVFGKVRYMNDKGCARKFDVRKYIATVGELKHPAG